MKIGLCCVSNNEYFIYLENFINRLNINNNDINLFVELYNVPDFKINWLKKFNFVNVVDSKHVLFPTWEIEKGFLTNRRVYLLNKYKNYGLDYIFYSDVNTLINVKLSEYLNKKPDFDIFAIIEEESNTFFNLKGVGPLGTKNYGNVLAGFQGYKISLITSNFLSEYLALVDGANTSWFADQEGLSLLINKYKNKVKIFGDISVGFNYKQILEVGHPDIVCAKGGNDRLLADLSCSINFQHSNHVIIFDKPHKIKISYLYRIITKLGNFFIYNRFKMIKIKKFYRLALWYLHKFINNNYIIAKAEGISLFVDTKMPGISKTLFVYQKRETDMVNIMRRIIKKGDIVLDCGSNIGFYPLLEKTLVGDTGKIICVEPDSRNWNVLDMNLNAVPNCTILHAAVSNSSGLVDMDASRATNLTRVITDNKFVRPTQKLSGKLLFSISSYSFDDLCEKFGLYPNFLRMDIEGHEIQVFQGMTNFLKSGRPLNILFETHSPYYNFEVFSKVMKNMFDAGFKPEILVSAGQALPELYSKLGYLPQEIIEVDGIKRGFYYDVNFNDAITLASAVPKCTRYMLLTRK